MLRTVNRVLAGLAGLLLLTAGLAVLAGGLGLPRRWGAGTRWPWAAPDDVLLTSGARLRWREEGWWWPAVIAALVVLALLALWWLLAQTRRRRLAEVLVDSGGGEGALLRGRALEDVVAAEAEALEGVARARVTLHGRRTRPHARLGVLLEPHAEPGPLTTALEERALGHARASAGLASLPAEIRLGAASRRPERVS
jgi:hypothetical protein